MHSTDMAIFNLVLVLALITAVDSVDPNSKSVQLRVVLDFPMELMRDCRDKREAQVTDDHVEIFAKNLGDKSSAEYQCAVGAIKNGGPALASALKSVDEGSRDDRFGVSFYDSIRKHKFSNGQAKIERLAGIVLAACQKYVQDPGHPTVGEPKRSDQIKLSLDVNACKVLIDAGIDENTVQKLGDWASQAYTSAKISESDAKKNAKKFKKESKLANRNLWKNLNFEADHYVKH